MVTKPKSIEDAADQALGAENVADFQTQQIGRAHV